MAAKAAAAAASYKKRVSTAVAFMRGHKVVDPLLF
jgi:hypothetical protein